MCCCFRYNLSTQEMDFVMEEELLDVLTRTMRALPVDTVTQAWGAPSTGRGARPVYDVRQGALVLHPERTTSDAWCVLMLIAFMIIATLMMMMPMDEQHAP